jgi:hypothetical protein
VAVVTHEGGEKRGVEPGAGADLQDPEAGRQLEALEHDGHDGRL